jgi:hypothetical protein
VVVEDAFRLLPVGIKGVPGAGAGAGEGVAPKAIDGITNGLLQLRALSGAADVPILDWLSNGLVCAPPGEQGDPTVAALRIRDLLLDALVGPGEGQPDFTGESQEADRIAEQFATGAIEVAAP